MPNNFISSGILEAYCLGVASKKQIADVLLMSALHPEVKKEVALITKAIQKVKRKEAFLSENKNLF